MGVCILLLTTLLSRIGTKKVFTFIAGVKPTDILSLNIEIENVCKAHAVERNLMRRIQISIDSLCEAIFEINPQIKLQYTVRYDQQQIKIHIENSEGKLPEFATGGEDGAESILDVTMMILQNMFDEVRSHFSNGKMSMDLNADL